jgi:alkyldihydroxyacetonephosphate synthase
MPVLKPYRPDSRHLSALSAIVGEGHVGTSDPVRMTYARDCHTIGILRTCEGQFPFPPDFVVWPADEGQVIRLVRYAGENRIPIIPFGAGSGVCRGVDPILGGLVIDLKRMNRILDLDAESLLVRVQAGMIGETFERELNHRGFTAGHFPSSIYCSTVGGWVATRAAGQLSTKYGKIEDIVCALSVVLPSGNVLRTDRVARMPHGPDLDQVFTGSEGTLGVITDATLRIRPAPESRQFLAFNFPDVAAGTEAIRRVLRHNVLPAAVRLYDELDTMLVGRSGKGGGGMLDFLPVPDVMKFLRSVIPGAVKSSRRTVMTRANLLNRVAPYMRDGCLLILTFEGETNLTALEVSVAQSVCEGAGGRMLGPDPARHWWENRYHVSFKQSKVMDAGAFVDTIEVATTWDRLMKLYAAVREGVSRHAFIMAHFSHAYPEGCSIYFTFVTAAKDAQAAGVLHHRVWAAAMEACDQVGATISHHHGVGLSKAEWMAQELGQAFPIHRAIKEILDPRNVMNPGKLGFA